MLIPNPSDQTPTCGDGGPCTIGGGTGLPTAPKAQYTTYGDCGCLAGATPVTLFSGATKLASEVTDGDVLLGIVDGEPKPQVARNRFQMIAPCVKITHEEGEFECSLSHVLPLEGGLVLSASSLCEEEHRLLTSDGRSIEILQIRPIGPMPVFGWTVSPDEIFVAAGLLHHNKTTPTVDVITL